MLLWRGNIDMTSTTSAENELMTTVKMTEQIEQALEDGLIQ